MQCWEMLPWILWWGHRMRSRLDVGDKTVQETGIECVQVFRGQGPTLLLCNDGLLSGMRVVLLRERVLLNRTRTEKWGVPWIWWNGQRRAVRESS